MSACGDSIRYAGIGTGVEGQTVGGECFHPCPGRAQQPRVRTRGIHVPHDATRRLPPEPHSRAAEQTSNREPQVTPTDQARVCREGICLGRLGSESRRRDLHSRESPPSRQSVTALRGKMVASSYIGFVLATSRRRQTQKDTLAHETTPYGEIPEAKRPDTQHKGVTHTRV